MSGHTRADEGEGREPGRPTCACGKVAVPDKIERAWSCPCGETAAWQHGDLSAAAHADALRRAARAEARTVQAEADVARLTAALAEAERERDEAKSDEESAWRDKEAAICAVSRRCLDLEASASALRERVATLEAALQPFANYAADMPGADFGEGEIGEYYHDGFRRSICTQDLRAARTALEAPHADN